MNNEYMTRVMVLGSSNINKINALDIERNEDDYLCNFLIKNIEVPSGVSDQPLSIEEIVQGASKRAEGAYTGFAWKSLSEGPVDIRYGVGIESGIYRAGRGAYLQTTICSVFNGDRDFIGQSSSYSHPGDVTDFLLSRKGTVEDAYMELGYTDSSDLGSREGAVGIVSRGKMKRLGVLREAVRNAIWELRMVEGS